MGGFALAALLSLPSARYTEESAIGMAATPNLAKQGAMQAYSPFNGKKYETLSYLPQLQNDDIRKQIEFMIRNRWTPCLEISGDGDIYLNTAMGPNYYDNRYWSLYKLPMFGCPIQTMLFARSKLARVTSPKRRSESLDLMQTSRCKQQD